MAAWRINAFPNGFTVPVLRVLAGYMCALLLMVQVNATAALADGIVSKVTSAPIFPNGIVRDVRAGINIFLQSETVQGDAFLNPQVLGYGIPDGGRMEVEMISGYQRDPEIPLDGRAIILVVGTPQQGLPAAISGLSIREGENQHTFVITPESGGAQAETLLSPAPGAAFDPVRQRGIKIIHIGRASAFVSRGEKGVVEVRIFDGDDNLLSSGRGEVKFLPEPLPQIYPTNIPHDQRNHDWQRVGVGKILGVASNTLPIPLLLFEKNEGLGNRGIFGAGVLSAPQLSEMNYTFPEALEQFTGGLILKDSDGNGLLDPVADTIIGGFSIEKPQGAAGDQVLTPLVSEKPFLSVSTGQYNPRAGAAIGGTIMQVVFIAGDTPGVYRLAFSLLREPGNPESGIGSSTTNTVIVTPQ